ncbi:hypothetical protein ACFXPR_31125 [Nocardia tengchongensis]|uniref:hypothetical protein n=1 Tax=Nocardia tengchongensis TaxID=2055889 RepID=UPI003677C270
MTFVNADDADQSALMVRCLNHPDTHIRFSDRQILGAYETAVVVEPVADGLHARYDNLLLSP